MTWPRSRVSPRPMFYPRDLTRPDRVKVRDSSMNHTKVEALPAETKKTDLGGVEEETETTITTTADTTTTTTPETTTDTITTILETTIDTITVSL